MRHIREILLDAIGDVLRKGQKMAEWNLDRIKMRCADDGGCWLWQQTKTSTGYPLGNFTRSGQSVRRYIFTDLLGKELKPGWRVVTTCGERACCNPEHLSAKSSGAILKKAYADGSRDTASEAASRREKLIESGRAKLDMEKARAIRQACASGASYRSQADIYSVSERTIGCVVAGEYWSDKRPAASIFELGAR